MYNSNQCDLNYYASLKLYIIVTLASKKEVMTFTILVCPSPTVVINPLLFSDLCSAVEKMILMK